jgi:hypothetical protein
MDSTGIALKLDQKSVVHYKEYSYFRSIDKLMKDRHIARRYFHIYHLSSVMGCSD